MKGFALSSARPWRTDGKRQVNRAIQDTEASLGRALKSRLALKWMLCVRSYSRLIPNHVPYRENGHSYVKTVSGKAN